jgi:hypothetical protein
MILLLFVILIPLAFTTLKVKQLVWTRDKQLPFMLGSLTLSIFLLILYFAFVNISEYHLVWQNSQVQSYICGTIFFSELPAIMLAVGVILNLNQWL